MSDDKKPNGPAHRVETVTTLRAKMTGIHAAAKEPHLNNAQVHKGLRDVADVLDHTLEILERVAGETADARKRADEALDKAATSKFPENEAVVKQLRHRAERLVRHERDIQSFKQAAENIRTKAESPNELKQRMASSDAEGLKNEVAEILSEIEGSVADVERKVGELDQRLTDEAERLDGRITDHEKAVDERFTNERKETNDKIEKIKPSKEGKGLGSVKSDIATLSQNMDKTRVYVNKKPSFAVPAYVGLAVLVVVFVFVWAVTAFNIPLAFLCGLGFAGLAAGLVCVILGSRQEELVYTTESENRSESQSKPGLADRGLAKLGLSRNSRDDGKYDEEYDEDDTDTRPNERVTTKETVRESAGSSR